MAPVKPKGAANRKARKTTVSASSSKSSSAKGVKRPPPKQVKTKPASATLSQSKPKKKKPQYTDSQLNLPSLNSIIPASATAAQRSGKGTGKKKNKIYVDDQESMMTILAMVNAEKEGVIESKMIKERQLEEIREARRKEAEKKAGEKQGKLEEVKKELKSGKKKNPKSKADSRANGSNEAVAKPDTDGNKRKRKSVSFA